MSNQINETYGAKIQRCDAQIAKGRVLQLNGVNYEIAWLKANPLTGKAEEQAKKSLAELSKIHGLLTQKLPKKLPNGITILSYEHVALEDDTASLKRARQNQITGMDEVTVGLKNLSQASKEEIQTRTFKYQTAETPESKKLCKEALQALVQVKEDYDAEIEARERLQNASPPRTWPTVAAGLMGIAGLVLNFLAKTIVKGALALFIAHIAGYILLTLFVLFLLYKASDAFYYRNDDKHCIRPVHMQLPKIEEGTRKADVYSDENLEPPEDTTEDVDDETATLYDTPPANKRLRE